MHEARLFTIVIPKRPVDLLEVGTIFLFPYSSPTTSGGHLPKPIRPLDFRPLPTRIFWPGDDPARQSLHS